MTQLKYENVVKINEATGLNNEPATDCDAQSG